MEFNNLQILGVVLLFLVLIGAVMFLTVFNTGAQTTTDDQTGTTGIAGGTTGSVTESDEFGAFDTSVLEERDAGSAPDLPS